MNIKESKTDSTSTYDIWEHVTKSRSVNRPTSLDYINSIFTNFIEFHGDRNYRDDKSIVGGIALLDGMPVTVIGQQKGRNVEENIERNFGMADPEGYRKSLRLMKQAEKFKRPIICFVDTPGAACGIGAEERGQGHAIATNLFELSSLQTPIISIVIGEGGSGGALALTIADEIWMMQYSIYSILSPEGFATILWKDSSKAKTAAELMKLTSYDLLDLKIIDKIIPEESDIEKNSDRTMSHLQASLIQTVKSLKSTPMKNIMKKRYNKYRNIGV
ncbi:acetyl-CoA carboxylase carboxyltransferase subunit alpha [Alkalibaculum sp. M08DMB]|uniref:Acetyl-coenzyme A carboxylase carboxyl transferase subunit alpha n=1 Tax=Alkalibaculum sporogenes TaxID=2655001 RepID=A0A6A7KBJ7_9FIRM|nr:acetyl-CoA carboxylase carboxyltransferase subunit alpha [Alkalibaculum sporogenes]MPW26383.1 acetyl-CoA carboxylase carboxyltransferase subunit alpha [Alkalibaculum sporogenes]